jgi:hypothetical protein
MRRIAALVCGLACFALPATAGAAVSPTRTASDVTTAMTSASASGAVSGSAFAQLAPAGNPAAVADSPFSDFPQDGTTFAVLSSGDTLHVDPAGADTQENGSTEANPGPRAGVNDLTSLRVNLTVPAGVNCAVLSFRFLTDEAPGAEFNDGFIAELDTNDWSIQPATDTDPSTIAAPNNFAFDSNGNVISVNSPGSASLTPDGATGTGFADGTARLTAATPVTAGEHSVFLSIFDFGDDIVDSAVLLDDLRLEQRAAGDCTRGAVDEVAPVVAVTEPEDGALSTDPAPTIAGTAGTEPGDSPNITVNVYAGTDAEGDPVQALSAAAEDGAWSVTPDELADGVYTVQALQVDDGGNVGRSTPVTFTVQRDEVAPVVRITSPFDHGATDDTTPGISGTAGNAPGDSSQVQVALRSGATVLQNLLAQRSGTAWSLEAAALAPGDYTLTASQEDEAGNVGTSPTITFTVNAPPPPPDDDTDTNPPPETPQPEQGKSVVAGTVSGTIRIRLKNGKFKTLGANESIPLGSTVDATKGRVRLTSAAGGGKTQTADFYKGQFKITQTKGKKPITQLELNGTLSCAKASAAAKKKKKKVRSLWGDGKGRFRTKGRRAAATVRGTRWFTQDTCDSTKITVKRGVVQVRDFVKRKNVTVKKGHSYVARKKRK